MHRSLAWPVCNPLMAGSALIVYDTGGLKVVISISLQPVFRMAQKTLIVEFGNARKWQPENAPLPMPVTLFGRTTMDSPVHPENA